MDLKKQGKYLVDGIREGISDEGLTLEETLESLVRVMGKVSGEEVKRIASQAVLGMQQGMETAFNAPRGASLPQIMVHAFNKAFGTEEKNLSEAVQKLIRLLSSNLVEQLDADEGTSLVDAISQLETMCMDKFVARLGAQPGTALPQAIDDFQKTTIQLTKANINRAKNQTIKNVSTSFYNIGRKTLITAMGIGTAVLAYYLFKKLTHPGSLNADSLRKSNLIVKSSGFSNGVMSNILNLFNNRSRPKKIILTTDLSTKAGEIATNLLYAIRNSESLCLKSVLLDGPRGTGKSLFVDHLITLSKLDYIKINRSSFIKFIGNRKSKAIAAIFSLLTSPKKPIIIVIEEADVLLNHADYKTDLMDLIKWLKVNNHKFMLMICAEDKKSLDNGLLDLIDQNLSFIMPTVHEREKFFTYNFSDFFKERGDAGFMQIAKSIITSEKIEEIAQKTDGFSYSRLEMLFNNLKMEILRTRSKFTKEIANKVIKNSIELKASLTL